MCRMWIPEKEGEWHHRASPAKAGRQGERSHREEQLRAAERVLQTPCLGPHCKRKRESAVRFGERKAVNPPGPTSARGELSETPVGEVFPSRRERSYV
jgi:hypothetical protein